MTRPWYLADTATRPPPGDSSTLMAPNLERKATSSSNVMTLAIGFSLSGLVGLGVEAQPTRANNAHDIHVERLRSVMRKASVGSDVARIPPRPAVPKC